LRGIQQSVEKWIFICATQLDDVYFIALKADQAVEA